MIVCLGYDDCDVAVLILDWFVWGYLVAVDRCLLLI